MENHEAEGEKVYRVNGWINKTFLRATDGLFFSFCTSVVSPLQTAILLFKMEKQGSSV